MVSSYGLAWQQSFAIIVLLYFYSHYLFASGAAHIGAMYTAFLSVAIACGTPGLLAAVALGQVGDLLQSHCNTIIAVGAYVLAFSQTPRSAQCPHASVPMHTGHPACPAAPQGVGPGVRGMFGLTCVLGSGCARVRAPTLRHANSGVVAAAVQCDGLPDDVRHRLRAAVLWCRLRPPVQVVPAGTPAVCVLHHSVAGHWRRVVEGHWSVVGRLHGSVALGLSTAYAQ